MKIEGGLLRWNFLWRRPFFIKDFFLVDQFFLLLQGTSLLLISFLLDTMIILSARYNDFVIYSLSRNRTYSLQSTSSWWKRVLIIGSNIGVSSDSL